MPTYAIPINSVQSGFLCYLCAAPWDTETAVACPACEAVACRDCVEDSSLKGRACLCGQPFDPAAFGPATRAVRALADAALPVLCKNHLRDCRWTGRRSELHGHQGGCPLRVEPRPVPVRPARTAASAQVEAELQCAICHDELSNPVCLPCCEKLLCQACARQCLQLRPHCPLCNAALTEGMLTAPPKLVVELLGSAMVRCPHHDVGCPFHDMRRCFPGHFAQCRFELGNPGVTTAMPKISVMHSVPRLQLQPVDVDPDGVDDDVVTMRGTFTTLLHIEAPALRQLHDRQTPLRLCAVIDVSGSMKGEKLRLTKESLLFMVTVLSDRDSFGLVVFDSRVERVLTMSAMTPDRKAEAVRLIEKLEPRACTDLCGGLRAGLQCVREAQAAAAAAGGAGPEAAAVMLFTDGQANEGIVEPTAVIQDMQRSLDGMHRAPAVFTFGFGANHNSSLLQRISETTQGSYYFVSHSSVLRDCFADCLGGLLSLVMSDLVVTSRCCCCSRRHAPSTDDEILF